MLRIAIIIPAYIVATFIGEAIASAERSVVHACERRRGELSPREMAIIVVDDASIDATASVVEVT
ncbi:glycosyltransferase [Azospirillum sp. sgz301742]